MNVPQSPPPDPDAGSAAPIDPDPDRDARIRPWLIEPDDWCRRFDWRRVFPSAPSEVEIDVGAGKGGLLIERAAAAPGVGFVGIERQLVRVRKIANKAIRDRLDNIRVLRAEARYTLEFLVPPATVRALFILFPDPWPKKRHARRRLLQPGIDTVLFRCLRPGGVVHVATDYAPYFEEIEELFARSAFFEPTDPDAPGNARPITEFERYYESIGTPIGRAVYRARLLP